jgi:hypothetical protein
MHKSKLEDILGEGGDSFLSADCYSYRADLLKLNLKKGVLRMLNRFAIVLHWLGFIGSVGFTGYLLWRLPIYFDQLLISDLPIIVPGVIGPLGSVWAIRFILTGHKGLMPWSKAKQPESPEN